MKSTLLLISTVVVACSAHDGLPINPILGVGGFPDCVQTRPGGPLPNDPEANTRTLACAQQPRDTADQIAIGCIGDSITAGVHSSGGNHTYPGQLQILLDQKYPGKYKVTNLGACGSTMMKGANSPYWKRPQYSALTTAKWDKIIIMLGTNDAKDTGSHGPANWPHNCTGAGQGSDPSQECPYFKDYGSMIDLVRTLGTTTGTSPDIHLAVPPPLMKDTVYGMNQTVINDVLPGLVRAINTHNKVPNDVIDVYSALGGVSSWHTSFPAHGCDKADPSVAKCGFFCDAQSCDQCHPDDVGYHAMAQAMQAGLGL